MSTGTFGKFPANRDEKTSLVWHEAGKKTATA